MTTFTIFAETNDGRITSRDLSYANARNGNGALIVIDNTSQGTFVGNQFFSSNSQYSVFQSYYDFDTSAIPLSDTIDDVTFSLHGTLVPETGTPPAWDAEVRARDWGSVITQSDFVAGGQLANDTLIATIDADSWIIEVYNDFSSETAFLGEIVAGGNTRMYISSSQTRQNITPTKFVRLEAFWANDDNSNQPRLVVETTSSPNTELTVAINVPIQSIAGVMVATTVITQPTLVNGELSFIAPVAENIAAIDGGPVAFESVFTGGRQ